MPMYACSSQPEMLVQGLNAKHPQAALSMASSWYDDAMRTIIDLPQEQIDALAEICERDNISRAEAIRRALSQWLSDDRRRRREEVLKRTFGAWKHYGIDTDTYLAELRSEWDREWDRDQDA